MSMLILDNIKKTYTQGLISKRITFSIEADLRFEEPKIVGRRGANGPGKTTLFEMMTGSNAPTQGKVICMGQDIHSVKYRERDRLAIHYHQSYQVRKIKRRKPSFLLESARQDYPSVHLFDEPQFNTQDGYIGFMLDFFQALRSDGKLVFICLHPMEQYHLQIMEETCEEFLFVYEGKITQAGSWQDYVADEKVRQYLGSNLEAYEGREGKMEDGVLE
jgi:ABC-type lipopolysaccharide export system ATPase subunit